MDGCYHPEACAGFGLRRGRDQMMGTAVLLLIPFFLLLVRHYVIDRNEAKATLRAERKGANGARPRSAQEGTSRSVVASQMTITVGASVLRAAGSLPASKSRTPETFLQALRAGSSGRHQPQPPETCSPIPAIETLQFRLEAVPHEFSLSQDVEERLGMPETSEPIRLSAFADWLRCPCRCFSR